MSGCLVNGGRCPYWEECSSGQCHATKRDIEQYGLTKPNITEPSMPFKVGDHIHGFAAGAFGRDSFDCRTVETVGPDWVQTRNVLGQVETLTDTWNIRCAFELKDERCYCGDYCQLKSPS